MNQRATWAILTVFWLLFGCGASEPAQIVLLPRSTDLSSAPTPQQGRRELRVFLHEKGFPPFDFGLPEGARPHGIYPEILDALCQKANLTWKPIPLPPGRVYEGFRSGNSNVEIGCSPQWRNNEKDISLYTEALSTDSNVLLFRKGGRFVIPGPRDTAPSQPKTVGTIIGYVYPSLEAQFRAGSLIRQDVNSEKTLLEVLNAGRVDAVIITELVALYYMKVASYPFELSEPRDELPLSIRIHTSLAWALAPLNRALQQLKADGTIDKIYRQYR